MYRSTRQKQANIYTEEQIRSVISKSGIEIASEVESDFLIFCPFHNNHRTPAGEVSKTSGTFFCFSCHESRSFIELLMFYTKKSFFEVTRLINSYEKNIDIVDDVSSFLEEKQEFHPFDRLLIKKLNNQALDSPRAIRYFEGRRISKESVSSLSLGYSEKQDMVTVPISTPDGSDFVGFVGRSIEGKSFRNTPGLPKSKVLFNLHRNKYKDHVYVVESSFDAIRLHQCGVSAVSTLGSSVSKKQIDLLKKYFNYVILIPDNDDAGKDMSKKITEVLGKQSISIGLPNRFKDIGDLADSDIVELTKRVNDPLLAIY